MVSSLNLDVVVSDCNEVCNRVMLHDSISLEEGANLPLLIVVGVKFFELCARADDLDLSGGEFRISQGHKALGRHLDPTLGCISDDEGHLG